MVVDLGRLKQRTPPSAAINIHMGCHGKAGQIIVPLPQLLTTGVYGRLECPECGRRYKVSAHLQVQAIMEENNDSTETPATSVPAGDTLDQSQ